MSGVRRLRIAGDNGVPTSRRVTRVAGALLLLGLAACGSDAPGQGKAGEAEDGGSAPVLGVEMDAEQQEKLGVEVGTVESGAFAPSIDGAAHVVDAQTVVAAMAELAKADSDARTSEAALKRAGDLFKLDTAVSAATLESAQRQAAADDAQVRVARARASLTFGARAPWLDAARRDRMLASLSSGDTLLVSASFPSGFGGAEPARIALRRPGAAATEVWSTAEVWAAPADPSVPGPAVLALLPAPAGLSYGERLTASIATGESLSGAVVPRSAVVLAGGEPWCYVQTTDDVFVRRRVDLGRPLAGGYFQAQGFAAGERVVVAGAGLLLAREIGGGAEED